MRELKFRAWSKEDKKLHKPQTLQEIHSKGIGLPQNDRIMMQFTGLKDKNGKEIYEGDIICKDGNKFEVRWDIDCWGYLDIPGYYVRGQLGELFCLCEVIGNKYENPELLK